MVIAYTPENVRLQNVTEIKGGHVTCCLISNTMDQILRSHENAIRPALTTQKLDRCNCSFNKCLIHVSQARYRLTLHPKKKKKHTLWNCLHAWGKMHRKTFRWRLGPKLVILIIIIWHYNKTKTAPEHFVQKQVPSLDLFQNEKRFIRACYPPTSLGEVQSQ
jgi:hypothetical protein